jgi:hypothetical protein
LLGAEISDIEIYQNLSQENFVSTGLLQQAIAFIKSGNKIKGQQLLAQFISAEPKNETAWLWMATVLDDKQKKRECLQQALLINPNNEASKKALAQIDASLSPPEHIEMPGIQDIVSTDVTPSGTKAQVAKEIGSLEKELAHLESQQQARAREVNLASGSRIVIIVILLLLVIISCVILNLPMPVENITCPLISFAVLGLTLLLAAIAGQNQAKKRLQEVEQRIALLRGRLGELRAQLLVM